MAPQASGMRWLSKSSTAGAAGRPLGPSTPAATTTAAQPSPNRLLTTPEAMLSS